VLSMPAQLDEGAPPRPLPWRRMAWVTWRQHRTALAGVGALLGGLAVSLSIVGFQVHHAYAAATACHPAASLACGELVNRFNGMDKFLGGYALQPVPALVGAFVGAPVLAREMETGTFRYAWTQGFGRWRWALAKLAALAVVVATASGALSVLISWYYQPYVATGTRSLVALSQVSPLGPGLFDLGGVGFAAWTLVAFAIGALAGIIVRRVVPAIVATLVAYTGLALAAGLYLRQHYLAPLVSTNPSAWVSSGSAWVISQQWTTQSGRTVSQSVLSKLLGGGPPQLAGKGGVPKAFGSGQYLVQHGYTLWTSYQPASRFWPLQLIEAGWLLALCVVLIATTVWLVRRRLA
jgi:hypothetical protein